MCTQRYTRVYTMVYTRVHSSPLLYRLLPFFSREYVLVSWWSLPRVLTMRALECLHCVRWVCLHYEHWGDGD